MRDLNAEPSLPYADDAFDAVVMTNAVEFLTSPRELFREARRRRPPPPPNARKRPATARARATPAR